MNTNREIKRYRLSAVLAIAAAMVLGMSVSGGYASMNDNRVHLPDQYTLMSSPVQTGTKDVAGTLSHDDTHFASRISDPSSEVALRSLPSTDDGLYARKGRKGGVKFEHGIPGHASASPEGALYAQKGRKGGINFEHGVPGHA